MDAVFILCPLCGGKTRLKLLPETVLRHFPLFCPKCRREFIICADHLKIAIEESKPDA